MISAKPTPLTSKHGQMALAQKVKRRRQEAAPGTSTPRKTASDCCPTFMMISQRAAPEAGHRAIARGRQDIGALRPHQHPGDIGRGQEMHIAQDAEIGLVDQAGRIFLAPLLEEGEFVIEAEIGEGQRDEDDRHRRPEQSRLSTGGAGIQPDISAKPVKKTSCQPNGLKNQPRSDQGSAGRLKCPRSAGSSQISHRDRRHQTDMHPLPAPPSSASSPG